MDALEKLKYAINQNNSGYVVIYDSNDIKIAKFQNSSSEKLSYEVAEFMNNWTYGEYKFMLKSSINMKPENAIWISEKLGGNIQENKNLNAIPIVDIEKIKNEIRLEIKTETETIRKAESLKDREDRIKLREEELNSGAGRLQELIMKAIMPIFTDVKQPIMDGINSSNVNTNNSNSNLIPSFGNDIDEEEKEEIFLEAFEIFKKYTDANTFMLFAKKVENNPNVIDQLKMLL